MPLGVFAYQLSAWAWATSGEPKSNFGSTTSRKGTACGADTGADMSCLLGQRAGQRTSLPELPPARGEVECPARIFVARNHTHHLDRPAQTPQSQRQLYFS